MHYYQFNIGDYASHTTGLEPIEDLAYRRLLDQYYLNESPPQGSPAEIARMIGLKGCEEEVKYVLARFFGRKQRGWVHPRVEEEIQAYRDKAETARKNGAKGGRPKKPKKTQPVSEKTQPKTNHKPITNNQEPYSLSGEEVYISRQWMLPDEKISDLAIQLGLSEVFIRETCIPKFSAHYDQQYLDNPIAALQKWCVNERAMT